MIRDIEEKYSVGALLYSPALNRKVADAVINNKYGHQYSMALCLEDTIADDSIKIAEQQLEATLGKIFNGLEKKQFYLPKIFIRVRSCDQMVRLHKVLQPYAEIITGFIFPKYTLSNADEYNSAVKEINMESSKTIYMMPILESSMFRTPVGPGVKKYTQIRAAAIIGTILGK